ncbi:transcription termination factor NusA [Candidatus Parcubacteria bacterium]|nr:transcription termination factor NusA [Patescibacteria group bacterium]MBU4482409.1 transcription termination factor NusA [Patescibacteria group bacterium]MCG2686506.1 transcription termination factor NusA [Candidatus Parcubacteria bacterium]
MNEELTLAIQQICDEKGLSMDAVKETIEEALAAAFRKDFGDKKTQNIKVEFKLESGDFKVFDVKEIVEDELQEKYEKLREEIEKMKEAGEDITTKLEEMRATRDGDSDEAEKKFNPRTMVSLSQAKQENPDARSGSRLNVGKIKIGNELVRKLEVPAEFGRMAAQTAKQVIIQKLREAERTNIFEEYKNKISDLIVGTVQRQEGKVVLVDLGSTTAIVLQQDQARNDNYKPGARMKFYVKSVEQTNRGPEILLSRSHPEMLRKLFKLEVPEINAGTVQIKAIARDAGLRSKIAVMAKEENLDPIGSCIGQRGTRVQTIINELGGEKIDIIEWDENLAKFITNALSPAKVLKIDINEENKTVKALVAEDQYSLAIGKGGQNVRLAAQLVGMRIDVVMEGGEKKEKEKEEEKEGKDKEKE